LPFFEQPLLFFEQPLPFFEQPLPQNEIFSLCSIFKKKLNGKTGTKQVPTQNYRMSSPISISNTSEILATISFLERQLTNLKTALGATAPKVVNSSKGGAKAAAAPGEKKAPNAWIVFTQKVDKALKEASISTGAATVSKQFASFLKDTKVYDEWNNEEIVAAWATWEKPEQQPKKGATSASESESSEGASKKERKKREPMTEEQKAAAKAKRAAKKAAASGAVLPVSEDSADEDVPVPAAPAPPAAKHAPKKVTQKSTFTIEQLADFDEFEFEDVKYGRNIRGDLINCDATYIGHWDAANKRIDKTAAPSDWAAIEKAMQ